MSDPFETGLFGGLPKTAIEHASNSTRGIIPPTDIGMAGAALSSSAPEKQSRSARRPAMLSSSGASSSMTAASRASIAPFFVMKGRICRRSLSDRLTQSLITSGLVKGITPSSTRKQSGQPILVLAFDTPVGGDAVTQKAVCSFSSAALHERSQS